jgi:transposase-like protein
LGKAARKSCEDDFREKVALDVIKGEYRVAELAAKYSIHPMMIMT